MNLTEKLQMLILLMDIHPETKELATNKLQTTAKDGSVIVFFQWVHRMVELKSIEEMWQIGGFQEYNDQKRRSIPQRKKESLTSRETVLLLLKKGTSGKRLFMEQDPEQL